MFKLKSFLKDNIFIIILFLLPLLIFWRNFFPFMPRVYFGNDSLLSFYNIQSVVDQIKAGNVPLWDPYTFFGVPLISRADSFVFYPPITFLVVLEVLLNLSIDHSFTLMELLAVLHLSFAGICTYFVVKKFNLSNFAAFVAGIIYMFNGTIIAFTNAVVLMISMTWLPITFLTFDNLLRKPSVKNMIIFSLVFAAPITTFSWQNAITYHLYLLGIYTIYFVWTKEINLEKSIKYLVPSFILALLLAAVVVLPGLRVPLVSDRAQLEYSLSAYGGNLKWRQLLDLFLPYLSANNYGEGSTIVVYPNTLPFIYVGILPLLLIIPAFFKKNKYVLFFTVLAGIFLLFTLGGETPIYDVLFIFIFPLMKPFRNVVKIGYLSFFCISIVSAYGIENITVYLKENFEKILKYRNALLHILYVILGVVVILYSRLDKMLWQFVPGYYSEKILSVSNVVLIFVVLFSLSLVCFYLVNHERSNYFKYLVAFVLILDFFIFAKNYPVNNYGINPQLLVSKNAVTEFMNKENNFYERADVRELPHNYAAGIQRLNHVDGYLVYRSKIVNKFLLLLSHPTFAKTLKITDLHYVLNNKESENPDVQSVLKVLYEPQRNSKLDSIGGIKYVVSNLDKVGDGYSLAFTDTINSANKNLYYFNGYSSVGWDQAPDGLKVNVFENSNYIPYVRYAKEVFPLNDDDAIAKIQSSNFNPMNQAVVSQPDISASLKTDSGKLTFDYSKPYKLIINSENTEPAFIVTSQPFYDDWFAKVNGNSQQIIRTNLAFIGVQVPAGNNVVELYYYPKIFYVGLFISLFTLSVTCGYLIISSIKKFK